MEQVAAYFRISLEDADKQRRLIDESQGISNQRKLVRAFIAQHPQLSKMQIVEYLDDGFTGTNFDRPQFTAMMDAAKSGKLKCIVVKDLSRFGRNYLEAGDYLEHVFPFLGIRFISINDNYDSHDYIGKTGGMDVAFRNFIYDSYSKDLSVKVRSAMRVRMEQGRFVNHVPYGYQKSPSDKHRMRPDPKTAPIVREIFQMAAGGISTSEIAKALNTRGIPTPLEYKGHKRKAECGNQEQMWSHRKVINILHNYKYTGAMINHIKESKHLRDRNQRRVPRADWIVTENAHEAIVSREEFESAAAALRKVKRVSRKAGGALDRVFYCGHCGRKLRKTFGSDTYFSCDTPMYWPDAPCKGVRWSKTALLDVLLPIYKAQLVLLGQKTEAWHQADSGVSAPNFAHDMAQLEKSISACDVEKLSLYEQYREGRLTREGFLQVKADLDARKARLKKEHEKKNAAYECRETARAQSEEEGRKIEAYLRGLHAPPERLLCEMFSAIERVTVLDETHLSVRWKFEDLFTDAGESDRQVV